MKKKCSKALIIFKEPAASIVPLSVRRHRNDYFSGKKKLPKDPM